MSIKDISQKYSEALFYSTVILFIVSIALAISLYSANSRSSNFKNTQRGSGSGMMQNRQDDFSQMRRLNRSEDGSTIPQGQAPADTTGQTPAAQNTGTIPPVE